MQVRLGCEVGFKLVPGKYLSDIVIEPKVTAVDLHLVDLDVQRISKIEGWAAHEIGAAIKGTIKDELENRGPKIAAKLNKSIAKRQDKLRFSPQQFLTSAWGKMQSTLGWQSESDAKECERRGYLPSVRHSQRSESGRIAPPCLPLWPPSPPTNL